MILVRPSIEHRPLTSEDLAKWEQNVQRIRDEHPGQNIITTAPETCPTLVLTELAGRRALAFAIGNRRS